MEKEAEKETNLRAGRSSMQHLVFLTTVFSSSSSSSGSGNGVVVGGMFDFFRIVLQGKKLGKRWGQNPVATSCGHDDPPTLARG